MKPYNVLAVGVVADFGITNIYLKTKFDMENKTLTNHETDNNANTVLPVVRLSMEEILRDAVRRQATYQVQFADYDLDTWTAPCQLTENRMEKLLDDGSIRKVRLELEM